MKGFSFWWIQRVTAFLLVPVIVLGLYFIVSDTIVLRSPHFLLKHPYFVMFSSMLLLVHGTMGVHVVLEDYVSNVLLRKVIATVLYLLSFAVFVTYLITVSLLKFY